MKRFRNAQDSCSALTRLMLLIVLTAVAGCAQARIQEPGPGNEPPGLNDAVFVAADGYRMPVTVWHAEGEVEAVVLALHGFNDFRQSHTALGEYLSARGVTVLAYDQRGFGGTEQRGIWPGTERLVDDAVLALTLLRARYPQTPLYLLGESMGGAVALLALADDDRPALAGTVLMAPAVWARETQPWYQRMGLWLGLRLTPGMRVSADWVAVEPTDDPEWADYWDEHPLVIHRVRVDALDGLTELMSDALATWPAVTDPLLVLYGGEDEVIPAEAICEMIRHHPDADDPQRRFAFYPDGWHFLARDSRAGETKADIQAWLADSEATLPSGRELSWHEARSRLCHQ
ncbi:alpha/beta fold hydrolase [Natronospira bacteriovora]|uniref:Alpha/beta fold hydrolase n=1 Tax=Natronospira bacteriovora TaxID=3069753 RepID=A0ABU0W9D3_9GAMM|nr:alpha/beta fold hydrolase [Natronospira sp. AB-CW4]MDQ2070045.1 alpha/beta fold hydrolase [Natronospira sp. AB-CW4]